MTHNHSGYLFDSNIVIAILDNDHAAVNLVRQAQEEKRRIFFSTITECEVLSGVKHNQFLIAEKLFSPRHMIHVDSVVSRKAASMQSEQRSKGRKIKTPDALIIATALTANLILVSRDSDMNFVTNEYGMTLLKI
ncbi:type II toxin-antitoxin system VapC family toxin [Paenibacillus thalictri]|uniref:Type II toxin-antitoxin system VapC family toxin n=2 Tax=Paenibacillaceae TaxID=186822 RepID=A0A4Q9DNR2_9BACL|nr:PIN domain-containing protein [Paenibacillus thalictri]TBL75232.1 type II toxin-antitoxin system VapC family toxin [Paenibacillus thalictri]